MIVRPSTTENSLFSTSSPVVGCFFLIYFLLRFFSFFSSHTSHLSSSGTILSNCCFPCLPISFYCFTLSFFLHTFPRLIKFASFVRLQLLQQNSAQLEAKLKKKFFTPWSLEGGGGKQTRRRDVNQPLLLFRLAKT